MKTYFKRVKPILIQVRDFVLQINHWRRWAIGSVLFFILMTLLCQKDQPSSAFQREDYYVVKKGSFIVDLIESGEVEALSKRSISTPMMWSSNMQIIDLAPEGTFVDSGDFLIQFDVSDLEERFTLNEERVESLKADLQRILAQQRRRISELESNIIIANYTNKQAQLTIESQQYESEAKKEEARILLKQAEIQLKTNQEMLEAQRIIDRSELLRIQTSIRQAESDQVITRERMDKMRLTAPAKGMVVYEDVGQMNSRERLRVGYTARPGEALVTIPDLAEMQVKAFINEVDRAKVLPGQSVDICLDAYQDAMFSGEVSEVARLAQMLEFEDNLKGFAVYVDIHGMDERLKPGMTAKVRIHLKEYEDIIAVPLGTVYEIDGQPVVFKGRGRSKNSVELGERNNGSVIITEGIRDGDKLSWTAPDEEVNILGLWAEQQRIQDLALTLRQSFNEFESRGILFDYFTQAISGEEKQDAMDSPPSGFPQGMPPDMQGMPGEPPQDVDWEAIRKRMQESGRMPGQQPGQSGGQRPSMTPPPGSGQTPGQPPQDVDWEAIRKQMQESGQGAQSSNRTPGQRQGQRGGQRRERTPGQQQEQGSRPDPAQQRNQSQPENSESQADREQNNNTE
ncbi:efflux RND transporter periplasmic adaptor subunit [candidate division KSB1 bacterium]|nr:efflux RND transporter periplasmic adaptor subunit [candidate division KSB1 bacterium]